jgi:metal-responsive CopG/Arc/MetJ family transcriptional regulator
MKKPIFESKAIAVKLDVDLLARIDAVAKHLCEPRSTIMRMAMRLGIEPLENVHAQQGIGELVFDDKYEDPRERTVIEEDVVPYKTKAPKKPKKKGGTYPSDNN